MAHEELQRQIAEFEANGGTITHLDIADRTHPDSHCVIRSMLKFDDKRPAAVKAMRAENARRLRLKELDKQEAA